MLGFSRQSLICDSRSIVEILVRGFARVGIIALVDEATVYEKDKQNDDLRRILEAYIKQGELRHWTERFPVDYYQEIFRLLGWTFDRTSSKRPRLLRILTSELVYKKLPPGVYADLKSKNPPVYKGGSRKHRHHQFLTEDIGDPHLQKQIVAVTILMRASRTWAEFKELFARTFPSSPDHQLEIVFPEPDDIYRRNTPRGNTSLLQSRAETIRGWRRFVAWHGYLGLG